MTTIPSTNSDTHCPLCGGENACEIAQGKSTCWCFWVHVPPEVRERIPSDFRERVCVCESCARSPESDEPDGTPVRR